MDASLQALIENLLARYRKERGGSVAETARGVLELSAMFNGRVPWRRGYLASRTLRRAYVHYYLPANAEKVLRVLREMDAYAPPGRPLRVLDFGCGPGAATIALLASGRPVGELWLVDVVDEALDDAEFFARALGAAPRRAHEPPPGPFDLILAAHVLSETGARLEPLLAEEGYLAVVEPALRETTRRLMEWRDRKVEEGYRVAAPCLGDSPCPMLEHADLWCHMDVPWARPSWVAEVDRRTGLRKESLKYAYAVVTPKGRTLADLPGDLRLVSNLHREKGKVWAWGCGRSGPLCRVEVLARHRSEATAAFFRAARGDVLEVETSGTFTRSQGPIRKVRPQPPEAPIRPRG
jgi:SAM-dependent methyltransferase